MSDHPENGDDVAGADDLTRIGGIGSKIAERLNAAGVRTYAELASLSAGDIMRLLPDVSGLALARLEGWRDQARELAAATAAAPAQAVPDSSVAAPSNGQHYESFLVRVLLNENGSIRKTTARHIRTGTERHWLGLGREALLDFIFIQAAASSSAPSAEVPEEQVSGEARQSEAAPAMVTPRPAEFQPTAVASGSAQAKPVHIASSACLSLETAVLRAAEPFTMTMSIDLAGATTGERFTYSAVVVAEPLGGGPKRTVAQSAGLLATTSSTISIDAAGLPSGAYRLDGAVRLRQPGRDHPVGLAAIAGGLLVQVLPR